LNEILRVLTAFSAAILPLTFVASIFGMNVLFPGEGTAEMFWVISGIMAVTFVAVLALFRRRGYL
jgi:magnesium transporter